MKVQTLAKVYEMLFSVSVLLFFCFNLKQSVKMEAVLLHFSDLISGSKNITTEQVTKQANADYISGVRAHYNFEPLKREQGKSVDLWNLVPILL